MLIKTSDTQGNRNFIKYIFFPSDVTDMELDHRIILEVWDWDRLTANDFIGGLSMRVGELLDLTKEKPFSSWYKLLDDKRSKTNHERIIADEEAAKVKGWSWGWSIKGGVLELKLGS